jgi:adenosylcobinamide-phosphate synthase
VRLVGGATQLGESLLRQPDQSPRTELLTGAALTITVVGLSWFAGKLAAERIGWPAEVILGWTTLAARNLCDESQAVLQALDQHDLPHARKRLARIVGRDTHALNETEIHRAVIETLAESACDGIIAPLFYLAIGGVPLALAYKAVNTLDSMIGHADQHYYYFGKASARLDDVANYLPARLTALAIALASGSRFLAAQRTWQRDGHKHKSPNAGQPESAMAGALGARLGGVNTYAGEPAYSPILGAEFEPPTLPQAKKALRLTVAVSILSAVAAALLLRKRPC